jgi:hypothetical protein
MNGVVKRSAVNVYGTYHLPAVSMKIREKITRHNQKIFRVPPGYKQYVLVHGELIPLTRSVLHLDHGVIKFLIKRSNDINK